MDFSGTIFVRIFVRREAVGIPVWFVKCATVCLWNPTTTTAYYLPEPTGTDVWWRANISSDIDWFILRTFFNCFLWPFWDGWLQVLLFRPGQSIVSSRLCLGQIVIAPILCGSTPKRPARFRIKFNSLRDGLLRRPRLELTPRLIRWEVMSSSHFTNGKIVEFPQTDHKRNLPNQTNNS